MRVSPKRQSLASVFCCEPFTERKALQQNPHASRTIADGYGLPTAKPFLVTFTPGSSDDLGLAKRCCDRFARARCDRSVNPVTLLAAIPPGLVTGAAADATALVKEATDDADGEARVLAEWVTCGWIAEGEGAALQAERRTSGNVLNRNVSPTLPVEDRRQRCALRCFCVCAVIRTRSALHPPVRLPLSMWTGRFPISATAKQIPWWLWIATVLESSASSRQ